MKPISKITLSTLAISISSGAFATKKNRYKSYESLARGLYYLETLYVEESKVEPEKLSFTALHGITENLDPHTTVLPRAFDQLTIDTQGKFGGIGVIVKTKGKKLIVIQPIDGSPADRAGIQAGDVIFEIDGQNLTESKAKDTSDIMRGEAGSKINLKIMRKKKVLSFTLKREVIKIKSVVSKPLGEDILYTKISNFQDNTYDELYKAIKKGKQYPKGLILDLRDNPGGLLDQAVKISDLFIDSGVIVSTVGRTKQSIEREFAHKKGTITNMPIIVILNGGSASASEIVAGALQDHERALIMGETSFGKGSVQTLISLPDGAGLKLTIARYYTPKDRSIQAKGITPDIRVSSETQKSSKKKSSIKESDLDGHIAGDDLSDVAKKTSMAAKTKSWPEHFKTDKQLKTAFKYMLGWRKFPK